MHRSITTAAVLVAATVLTTGAAHAGGAEVTSGHFGLYPTGESSTPDLRGRAHMVRVPSGKTIVTVEVTGLAPNTTYGAHVHALPCGTNQAGGHYKHDPVGPPAPPNEIWPGFTTDASGAGSGKDTASFIARAEAQSVVIHAPGGTKIACADLG